MKRKQITAIVLSAVLAFGTAGTSLAAAPGGEYQTAVLEEGQKVKVKIIAVKDGKISLSMKALEDVAAAEIEEETFELPESEAATTSLASLFKNIKL